MVVSVKEAVAREPSDSSAKVFPVESKKVIAFGNIDFWEEDFSLSTMLKVSPLLVP